jgi:hypothetical protein
MRDETNMQSSLSGMNSSHPALKIGRWFLSLLLAQTLCVTGCTSILWDEHTFADHHEPAHPAHLRLSYSKERKDILVQYDEFSVTDNKTRPRCYWLEPNTMRVNRERKPHFVSLKESEGLIPIQVTDAPLHSVPPTSTDLHAVAPPDRNFFTLYSGNEQLDPYQLPTYKAASQTVKQIALTPFSVAIDATIVGAVIAYVSAPAIASSYYH